MPATAPIVTIDQVGNYSPANGAKLVELFNQGLPFILRLPFTFATADGAALYTVPAGFELYVDRVWWNITTSMTGGTTPAIGVSSDDANFSTKGDLLGGASGDLTATLVSTGRPHKGGTVGAKFGSNGIVVLGAGKIVRFDRIADVFAAGAGNVFLLARPFINAA